MIEPKVLIKRNFKPNDIIVSISDSNRKINPVIESQLDTCTVGFYFDILLNITSELLLERFRNEMKDLDVKSLKIMSHSEFVEELKNHNTNKQWLATQIEALSPA